MRKIAATAALVLLALLLLAAPAMADEGTPGSAPVGDDLPTLPVQVDPTPGHPAPAPAPPVGPAPVSAELAGGRSPAVLLAVGLTGAAGFVFFSVATRTRRSP
jgi:hypothetical protein